MFEHNSPSYNAGSTCDFTKYEHYPHKCVSIVRVTTEIFQV